MQIGVERRKRDHAEGRQRLPERRCMGADQESMTVERPGHRAPVRLHERAIRAGSEGGNGRKSVGIRTWHARILCIGAGAASTIPDPRPTSRYAENTPCGLRSVRIWYRHHHNGPPT